ncbi:endonuclease/exonuclease/phosphatase family protein [Streptacidiphilus monticola]|uniref:Endonuclease/exonuclease/phosphatase family protein n=1 Tax=Streptacidiphilus monticola TaxID=2161674 RepID=A0ABW1G084_9ACTN
MDETVVDAVTQLPLSGPEADGGEVVRVLSYNIRSLRDDRTAVVRVIRACDPDLVCIQESPRFWFPRPQAAWLARATGLMVLSGGPSASGPLLLGRLRALPLSVHDVLLPKRAGLHQRGFATTVVRLGRGAPFSLTSCHLSLDADERFEHFKALLAHVSTTDVPHHVIGGDFNEHPDKPGWQLLASRMQDGWVAAPWGGEYTSVPDNPYQRIDGVFASPGIEVLACGVPHGLPRDRDLRSASDHLPVLAVLRVPPGAL